MSTARHTRRPSRIRAALTALAMLATVGTTVAATAAPASAVSPALSGVYSGAGDVAGAAAFETWRGRDMGVVQDFVDASTWTSIANPTWLADRWKHTDHLLALSVPMLPKSGGTIEAGATGSYNQHFTQLSRTLVSRGLGDSVIRLGWEMNGTWFAWSAVKNPNAFNAYWRHAVNSMRSVSGAKFKFEWAPNLGEGTAGFDKTRAYPGDAYVDLIGTSMYDQSWGLSPSQDVERWRDQVSQRYGLQWSVDFARAHGKQNSLPEWGLSDRCDGHGGGDNPHYITEVLKWVASHDYFYETYFDYRTSSCEQHSILDGPFPSARNAYVTAMRASATATAPAAPSTGTTSVSPSAVKVSWRSDRSNALSLAWLGLRTNVYIFAQPTFTVTRASFYLDDPDMSGAPVSTDTAAPWDLKGGTSAAAVPFDAQALSPGKHTVTVRFETPSGTKVTTVTFLR